ncbi:PREDICTED: non-specific lipid-transfer protein 2-like [Lupinus angustifolius]|nr:PREDICTED: non-specific lipid-transfer protein 2-like [Lupinus angustifolius]
MHHHTETIQHTSHSYTHTQNPKVKMKATHIALCTFLVLLLASEVQVSMAVTCSPVQLSPCASAITSSSAPSNLCCSRIKEQKPCLCQYLKNPNLKKFVNTPNARRVASTCGTPFPRC